MKKFKSKIDLWLIIPLALLFSLLLIWMIYDQNWPAAIIILLTIIFITHIFLATFYIIENDRLQIKCGFLFNTSIEIKNIKTISESSSILSSPALSLDRLEILYNQYDTILISPKDKEKFSEEIKRINPEVKIVLKT